MQVHGLVSATNIHTCGRLGGVLLLLLLLLLNMVAMG